MGNMFRRLANFVSNIYHEDKIIYARELQLSLPVAQNNIYKENDIQNSYICKEYNDIDLKKSTNATLL